jgi:hypothetical protein
MHQGGTVRDPDPATGQRYERDWRAFVAMRRQRHEIDSTDNPFAGI